MVPIKLRADDADQITLRVIDWPSTIARTDRGRNLDGLIAETPGLSAPLRFNTLPPAGVGLSASTQLPAVARVFSSPALEQSQDKARQAWKNHEDRTDGLKRNSHRLGRSTKRNAAISTSRSRSGRRRALIVSNYPLAPLSLIIACLSLRLALLAFLVCA